MLGNPTAPSSVAEIVVRSTASEPSSAGSMSSPGKTSPLPCFFHSRPFALITDSIAWAMLMDSGVHEDDAAWAARRTSERERTSLTAGRGWPWMVVRLSCPQNQIWKLMLADSVKK